MLKKLKILNNNDVYILSGLHRLGFFSSAVELARCFSSTSGYAGTFNSVMTRAHMFMKLNGSPRNFSISNKYIPRHTWRCVLTGDNDCARQRERPFLPCTGSTPTARLDLPP